MKSGTETDRITELEDDNRRLRRLLNQRDAPGELRHRLRSTLALLLSVLRKSANTKRDLPDYVAHLEDRLDAIARAQSAAEQHGKVDLRTLVADELLRYGALEGEKLGLSGPEIELLPRAGQIFALAIHELAVNAVEHGALGTENGRVEVSWSVANADPAKLFCLTWRERGVSAEASPAHSGFGTEVLTRMLAYDLKAETDISFEPGELRCTIRLPLTEQIGSVTPPHIPPANGLSATF